MPFDGFLGPPSSMALLTRILHHRFHYNTLQIFKQSKHPENRDDDAPIYPVAYLSSANAAKGKIEVYLKKFIFCNSAGVLAAPGGAYTVVGYKKKSMPISW